MSAFILNFQGPRDPEDIEYYCLEGGSNLDLLLMDCVGTHETNWSVPESAKPGDIAIFSCARTSKDRLGMARARLDDDALLEFADRQYDLYKKYSGKIMAIGIISDDDAAEYRSWNMPYRNIVDLRLLSRPIDMKELNGIIKLNSYGSVTYLDDMQWAYLRNYINSSELESMSTYIKNLNNYDLYSKNWKKPKKKVNKERSKMSNRLRYEILKRDGFRCVICGRTAEDGIKLEVDHILPISKGGRTETDNLRTLCNECNGGKSDLYEENNIN